MPGTHHDQRVADPSDDIEAVLERKREVAEHASRHVHNHEQDGDTDDLLVLVNFVVLRAAMWSVSLVQ